MGRTEYTFLFGSFSNPVFLRLGPKRKLNNSQESVGRTSEIPFFLCTIRTPITSFVFEVMECRTQKSDGGGLGVVYGRHTGTHETDTVS